ncbi:potassium-transporting ATPase subunit beta [Bufo gargarizans]|uniref:potassium-transporting ATPase subunit beta n=1 Tax=Bufo gargarizans TaxID=30331 RepID=UPI001CF13FB9|nr:potassium-transporting ATPase subunit beta [Bufo gargarizans]
MATFNEKKTCSERMQNFGRFVWNPDTGELLGRTLVKWVFISLYYVAFYIIMIGLFALSIYSLMKTLDPYEPDYKDQLQSPGVTIRPSVYVDEDIEIVYNISDENSYRGIVKSLHTFLSVYNKTKQHEMMNKDCSNLTDVKSLLAGGGRTKHACQFTTDMLGNCSCDNDPTFGYASGQPCIYIKMNRIIQFMPDNATAPTLHCTSKDDLGPVEYFPHGSFGLQYFPYYGKLAQPNYTNPLVAVKLLNPAKNHALKIVCRVNGSHIISDNPHDPYEGKVTFTLKIEN